MSSKSNCVVSSVALLSTMALAQEYTQGGQTQTIIRDVEVTTATVPAPLFTNEVTISGLGFRHTTIDRTDEYSGIKKDGQRSLTKLATVEPSIMARSTFGKWVVRPGLAIHTEGTVGSLGFGYDTGFVEVGALVTTAFNNGILAEREGILASSLGKYDASDRTFAAYAVVKTVWADPLSLELEGQLGYRRIFVDQTSLPTTDMDGLAGKAVATAFVDVAPQLGLGFSAGLHFNTLSGKMPLGPNLVKGDSKVTRITWNFQLANVRYRF